MDKNVLHWSYRNCKTIPEDLKNYSNCLEEIYLKENFISSIPGWLLEICNLKFIHLAGNVLKKIPEDIDLLENLHFLDVSDNCLRVLPKSIGNLQKLKQLNVSGNYLENLPEELGKLKQAESFNFSGNMLCSIPLEIGYCYNLVEIILSDNKYLQSIPERISNLPNLDKLCADRCGLFYLPGLLSKTINHLRIFNNRFLKHIPISYEKFFLNYYEMHSYPPCNSFRPPDCCIEIKEINTNNILHVSNNVKRILIGSEMNAPSLFEICLRNIESFMKQGVNFQIKTLPHILRQYIGNGPITGCAYMECRKLLFSEYYLTVLKRFHSNIIVTSTFCSPKCRSQWILDNRAKYFPIEWEMN